VHAQLLEAVAGIESVDDMAARIDDLSVWYFALHRDDPLVRGLWGAVQTDPALQALDVADSLRNAEALFRLGRPLYRKVDDARLMAACALTMQLAVSAARFALAIPEPLSALSASVFSDMVRKAFLGLEEG
jgi:hypothetical protein